MFPNHDLFPTPTGCSDGLHARHYFAVTALRALLSNPAIKDIHPDDVAKLAVQYADALIAAL
jgi:hypothetical protein